MNARPAAGNFLARLAASALCRGGREAALLVFTYHRVLAERDPLLPDEPDAAEFAAQLDMLSGVFNIIGLREAGERLLCGSLPARAACITFDDGYANNCDVALPQLVERRIPATVFVATGFLGGGRMFNDTVIEAVRRAGDELNLESVGLGRHALHDSDARCRAIDQILRAIKHINPLDRLQRAERIAEIVGAKLPDDLMMTESQVRRLADSGIEIGAHTVTHPILTRVGPDMARAEIRGSKQALEDITGRPATSFAYPNGRPNVDYDAGHVRMVQEAGFAIAVSTAHGAATAGQDMLQVPRVSPWGKPGLRMALRLSLAFRARRYASAATAPGGAP